MAFKCLYFVMLKRGAQQHISVCMTVNSESPMSKDHFTAGRECEIMHTQAHRCTIYMQECRPSAASQLGSFIYSQRGSY